MSENVAVEQSVESVKLVVDNVMLSMSSLHEFSVLITAD